MSDLKMTKTLQTHHWLVVFFILVVKHGSEHETVVLLAVEEVVWHQLRHEDWFTRQPSK